jgi:hypothetical protein
MVHFRGLWEGRRKRGWWWPKMAMWHQVDLTIVHFRGLRKREEGGGVKTEKRNLQ